MGRASTGRVFERWRSVSKCSIHEGDVGATIYVDVVDCDGVAIPTDASTVELYLTKPRTCTVIGPYVMPFSTEGASVGRVAATGDGLDGRHMYTTIAAQIDEVGTWKGQPRITTGGVILWGAEFSFVVKKTAIT